jgi:hypothetical protein
MALETREGRCHANSHEVARHPRTVLGNLSKIRDRVPMTHYPRKDMASAMRSRPSEAELRSRVAPRVAPLNPLRVAPPYSGRSYYAQAVSGAQ